MNLTRRTRTALVAVAAAAALGVPLAATAASASPARVPVAMAQHARAAAPANLGPFNMCLTNDCRLRWKANGVGNQVTISSSGADYMTVTWISAGNDGYPIYEFQTGQGHCLYANGAGQLIVGSNSGCDTSRDDERFEVVPAANGGFTLGSRQYLTSVILVFNNLSGKPAYVKPFTPGAWDNWNTP